MELARSCHYAIRGLVFLASRERPGEPVLLHEIAEATGAPEAFLSKIFQSLRASGLVRSHRGMARGYSLALDPADVTLYDIIVAAEGPATLHTSPGVSAGAGSPFAQVWDQVEDLVAAKLRQTTIANLASLSKKGDASESMAS